MGLRRAQSSPSRLGSISRARPGSISRATQRASIGRQSLFVIVAFVTVFAGSCRSNGDPAGGSGGPSAIIADATTAPSTAVSSAGPVVTDGPVVTGAISAPQTSAAVPSVHSSTSQPDNEDRRTLRLGIIASLTGPGAGPNVTGLRNAVELAARFATDERRVPGWKVDVVVVDDRSRVDGATAAGSRLADDRQIFGVIGPLSPEAARRATIALSKAGVVTIVPISTDPGLTRGDDDTRPVRRDQTLFRVTPVESVEGPLAADFAVAELKVNRVVVIREDTAYARRLADSFIARVQGVGVEVAATEITTGAASSAAIAERVAPLAPGAVLYAGAAAGAAAQERALQDLGLRVPLIVGSAVCSTPTDDPNTPWAEGDLCMVAGAPTETTESARAFREDYAAANLADAPGPLGAAGYDAANLLIDAAARLLRTKSDLRVARRSVAGVIQSAVRSGATGALSFDQFGDLLVQTGTVMRWNGATWMPLASRVAG